jgi:hypothetical protein
LHAAAVQEVRTAASQEQDRLRQQWQQEMAMRERRGQQQAAETERRLDDATETLRKERSDALRERQQRIEAQEQAAELKVCTARCRGAWAAAVHVALVAVS